MRSFLPLLLSLCLFGFFLSACDSDPDTPQQDFPEPRAVSDSSYTVTASGLKFYDFAVGTGDTARAGDQVQVNYDGWLTTGQFFDGSRLSGRPISFILGKNMVIPGFEEGITGMVEGGDRQLIIPPGLAYGAESNGVIPPNATLIFEVQLVNTTHPQTTASSNP